MHDPDKLEQLKSCNGPDFDEFYSVYAESISQREQKSRPWICEMVARPDYKVFLLKRAGHVTGFSIVFLPVSEAFGLLEYMAVSAEQRNQGLGAEIFQHTMRNMQPAPGPILLEVDSEREDCADRGLRTRRQQFYRRLGCLRFSGLHYILPLSGSGPPPEMDLMVYSTEKLPYISKAQLETWLKVIYHEVYSCSPNDSRIQQMLRGVPDPAHLE